MKNKKIKFIVQKALTNLTIQEYFSTYHVNKSIINYAINKKNLFVNGLYINSNKHILINGDLVEIILPYESIKPFNYQIKILYEDEYIIAVDKKNNILVHTDGNTFDTLTNAVWNYLKKEDDTPYAYPIHRLDYETTGIVVFAKNPIVLSFLSVEIEKHNVTKEYVCLCHNKFIKTKGIIKTPIGKDRHSNKQIINKNGKQACTEYEVLSQNQYTKVKVNIIHGRKHQIRVHMSSINHPIVGDKIYGINDNESLKLHFKKMVLTHPYTRETITIESKEDF